MSRVQPRIFLKGLVLILTLSGIAWLIEATPVHSLLDRTWVEHQVLGRGINGELLFLGTGALAVALGMPRQAVSFLSGYAFGVGWGTVLGVIATTAGCLVNFYYARWIGRDLVSGRFRERMRRIEDFIHDNTFNMTLLIRLLPAGSNLVTNLAAGVSGVRATPFVLASVLGYIPQTLVFALVGSGVSLDPLYRVGLGVAIFLVSGLLGIRLYRQFRHGRHLDAQLEEKLGVDG